MKKIFGGSLFILGLCLALLVVTTQTTADNPKFETVSGIITNIPEMTQMGEQWFDGAGNLHRRGWFLHFEIMSSDPRLDGATVVEELNSNFFANRTFDGNLWGKLWVTQTDGGVWEGSITAKQIGGQQFATAVAQGKGGTIDGKKIKATIVSRPGTYPAINDFTAVIH